MTPDAPLSEPKVYCRTYDGMDEDIEWSPGQKKYRPEVARYVSLVDYQTLASERDELKYKMQVMADMVGEENWSLRNQLADAQARCTQLHEGMDAQDKFIGELKQQHAALREALTSIANNTCCGPCREAGLVARKALATGAEGKETPT